jgi:hypothetical protein
MVERYVPGATEASLEQYRKRLEAAAEEVSAGGTLVRYLGSTFVPEEESCFCWFESANAVGVSRVCKRAQIPFARIVVAHGRAPVQEP